MQPRNFSLSYFPVENANLTPYMKPQISFQIWEWDNFTRAEVVDKYYLTQTNFSSTEPHFEYSRRVKIDKEAVRELIWKVGWSSCVGPQPGSYELFGEFQVIFRNFTDQWVMFTTKKSTSTHALNLVAATKNTNCSENTESKSVFVNVTYILEVTELADWN